MSERIVLLSDAESPEGAGLEFRLTYKGPLFACQNEARGNQPVPKAEHKNQLRRAFHEQMARLWIEDRALKTFQEYPSAFGLAGSLGDQQMPMDVLLSHAHETCGRRFVPLVRKGWHLSCRLAILFLRHDPPGALIKAGDIDNRIKVLLDGLRMPKESNEMVGLTHDEGKTAPFYCLMEDDDLITAFSVETDRLLEVGDANQVQLVIKADVRPYFLTMDNVMFG